MKAKDEAEFSDYISSFKNMIMKTASHVGTGGDDGGQATLENFDRLLNFLDR